MTSRNRIGVRPITALLGVKGSSGERRTSATVRMPPSAARSASARTRGRSSNACAAALPASARAIEKAEAALVTAASSERRPSGIPYSQPQATISGTMGKSKSVRR